ncbi:hypothetical protein AAG906_039345 [Vitis piasezkii]
MKFLLCLYRLMDATNMIYCYIFVGGKLVQKTDGQWEYVGGRSKGIHIYKGMPFEEFTKKILEKFDISFDAMKMHYTLKFNPRVIQDLEDEDDLDKVVSHSDDFANVYLVDLPCLPAPFPSSNASCDAIPNTMMLSRGFMSRCADSEYTPLESIRFREAILGSGHTFKMKRSFRTFEYKYKKNSPTHMSVKCSVEGCPWKITAHTVEGNVILRVHTYQVNHNHIAQDECSSKVKDFEHDHGVQLTYNQAWHLKEKAKERIYGAPRESYTFVPWLCHRLREINPGTIAEYTSDEGHFMQLFIAHAFSIQGFIKGCRPVLAIDSCHLSGPYKGALLSAIAYDADDGMFPLALGVVGSKIIRIGNHAYCYQHVKENFSSFLNKQNIRGKKGKEDALLLLDSIAYARLEIDYNEAFEKLVRFNDNLGKWVAENNPEHWAMSKFLKKRWDKMTSNIAESFNAWLRDERHQTIYTLLLMHMDKLVAMLDTHMRGIEKWKSVVGPKTEEKLMSNIMSRWILQIASTPSEHPFGTLNTCEERLLNLPVWEEFRRCFLYYACATILAPTSRIDGCRNLWHTIHEDGFRNDVNWGQFVVDQLVEGIRRFKQRNSVWLHYVIKFKIPSVHVPVTVPLLSAWSDDLIKERLAVEISQFGSFGHGEGFDYSSPPVCHRPYLTAHTHVESVMATSTHVRILVSILCRTCNKSISKGHSAPARHHAWCDAYIGWPKTTKSTFAADSSYAAHEFPQPEPHSDYGGDDIASHGTTDAMVVAPSDWSGRRRRVRRLAPNLLSPFIAQPQTRQSAIKMDLKEAAAIVFDGALDPRFDIAYNTPLSNELVAMHDTALRGNLTSFQGNSWIGNHEMVMRSNGKHLTREAVIGRFERYLYPIDVSYQNVNEVYLPVLLKNHWSLYVYDLHNKRIQLLDSRPGRRRSCMSGIQQNLAKVVLWLVGYKKQMVDVDFKMFPFCHARRTNNDCGVFVMKFMDSWSNGGLSKSIDVGKINKYRLKILGRLLLSSHNAHRQRFLVD